jgi:hypothetical protein
MLIRPSLLAPIAATLLVGMAFTTSSLGQSPQDGLTAVERAKQLFDQGNAFYDQEKLKEAEEAYQKAWDLHRSYYIAANLGNVEMLIGQKCDAVEHLIFAAADFPPVGTPLEKERLLARLLEARRQVAFLEVDVDVAGAEVRVDGKRVGTSPLPGELCVEQGSRVVEAMRAGYDGALEEPHAVRGVSTGVKMHLKPRPKSFFEGKDAALIAVGGGLTVAGLGLGIGGAVGANTKSSRKRELQGQLVPGQCNDAQPLCVELDRTLTSIDTATNLSIAGFVEAGVAAAATGVYLLWPSSWPSVEASAAVLVPVITGSSGGFVVYGQF